MLRAGIVELANVSMPGGGRRFVGESERKRGTVASWREVRQALPGIDSKAAEKAYATLLRELRQMGVEPTGWFKQPMGVTQWAELNGLAGSERRGARRNTFVL